MKNEQYIPALGYDRLTPLYDTVVRLTTREKTFKSALVGQLRAKNCERILDLACGTGTLAILIKNDFPESEITGIDGDPKILGIARQKAEKAGAAIEFEQGMSFDLPFADESFDAVVSSLFFHHLTRDNKSKTLVEVRRVLKPGGELHVADWGLPANSLMRLSSCLIKRLDGEETTADSFNGLLLELMAKAGFDAVEETNSFNSAFGTIRLHKARRNA